MQCQVCGNHYAGPRSPSRLRMSRPLRSIASSVQSTRWRRRVDIAAARSSAMASSRTTRFFAAITARERAGDGEGYASSANDDTARRAGFDDDAGDAIERVPWLT